MPVQVIINAVSPDDAIQQMAAFIGLRGLQNQTQEPITAQLGNGSAGTVGEAAAAPKTRGRKPKAETQEAPAEQTAAVEEEVDFLHGDEEQQPAAATGDDVRKALKEFYLDKYGTEATQADVLKLYKLIFKDGGVTKVSEIPEGREQDVIDGIKEMGAKNPFKRPRAQA